LGRFTGLSPVRPLPKAGRSEGRFIMDNGVVPMARKTPETPTTKPATFDLNDPTLKAIMAEAVATALAAQQAAFEAKFEAAKLSQPATLSVAGKSERAIKNEIQAVRAFQKAGFKDAKPHVNILTFNKWMEKGRRPLEKSKAVRVNNLRLWHVSQTRPVKPEELKAMKQQQSDAIKRHEGKAKGNVTELHPAQ
jgi:hypothetical protein